MTRDLPDSHPLHRLFRGMAEATFLEELGIGDPSLVGYVAGLLARFVPTEAVWQLRDRNGKRLRDVAAMVDSAEQATESRERCERYRHVGDYTLFWSGVYPEAIGLMKANGSSDSLIDFCRQGKRSYDLASRLDDERAAVLRRLSEEFELCAFGLTRVRREWEKLEADPDRRPGILS